MALEQPLLEEQPPLLVAATTASDSSSLEKQTKTPTQKALRKTFKGTAHLSNLLPTGSVLAFQLLSPILTNQGQCRTQVSLSMTLTLLALCGLSCFIVCFTDSFRDPRGKVRYGLATFCGLWVIDGSVTLEPKVAAQYRLRFIDFFHAIISVLVFGAVALFDQNVVNCLFPIRSEETKELLASLPMAIGVVCSLLFVAFPSTRHGIGFPLSRQ